jgi:hypothetical protein
MSKKHSEISPDLKHFIEQQKIFFVGTAAAQGQVNISPKGMDSLRVVNSARVVWLNLTGSGNETSAHIQQLNRMTLMFCAFAGEPMILRLYGRARELGPGDAGWDELASLFTAYPGQRQIFDLTVDLVVTSCGFGVPEYHYVEDRETLNNWADKKGEAGIRDYWEKNNQVSLDGFPTGILDKYTDEE